MSDPDMGALSAEQRARVKALSVARGVLVSAPTLDPGVTDLVSLAEWVLTGRDPYASPVFDAERHEVEEVQPPRLIRPTED